MTAQRRARSPPTGLVGVCSRSLCSAPALPCAPACDGRCLFAQLVRGSAAAPLALPLAADRSSLSAIAARCRAAAPDHAAAGSLTADRPGRRMFALAVLCAQCCHARPRSTSRCFRARRVRGSFAAPLPHPLAADRSSLRAVAARRRAGVPDREAAGSLTAGRPGRRLLELKCYARSADVRPRVRCAVVFERGSARLDHRAVPAPARRRSQITLRGRGSLPRRRA